MSSAPIAGMIILALTTAACDWPGEQPAPASRASITVKLPAARPATPRPGFAFKEPEDAGALARS
jgi:hypothetical protein